MTLTLPCRAVAGGPGAGRQLLPCGVRAARRLRPRGAEHSLHALARRRYRGLSVGGAPVRRPAHVLASASKGAPPAPTSANGNSDANGSQHSSNGGPQLGSSDSDVIDATAKPVETSTPAGASPTERGDGDSPQSWWPAKLTVLKNWIAASLAYVAGLLSSIAKSKVVRSVLSCLLIGATLHFSTQRLQSRPPPPRPIVYSQFLEQVREGNVQAVLFVDDSKKILFKLKEDAEELRSLAHSKAKSIGVAALAKTVKAQEDEKPAERSQSEQEQKQALVYSTRRVEDPGLVGLLSKHDVEFGAEAQAAGAMFQRAMLTALALWLPFIPLLLIARRMMNGRDGGSKRKNDKQSMLTGVTFNDVAGVDEAKVELQEVVSFLRNPEKYKSIGAKLPAGVLLIGPPGTGKTLLARAVAGEAGVPFFQANASEFVELFVGRGASRVRELFREAKRRAPAVVFIDEIDAVGARRGFVQNDERDQTLNQLLAEMDGFSGASRVVVLAATNRAEVLDPALCRPGRIARRVTVGVPNEIGRRAILQVHLRKVAVDKEVAFEGRAKMPTEPLSEAEQEHLDRSARERIIVAAAAITPGFAGAELANVVNEAALLAVREGRNSIRLSDIVWAVERAKLGIGSVGPGFSLRQAAVRWVGNLAKQVNSPGKDRESITPTA